MEPVPHAEGQTKEVPETLSCWSVTSHDRNYHRAGRNYSAHRTIGRPCNPGASQRYDSIRALQRQQPVQQPESLRRGRTPAWRIWTLLDLLTEAEEEVDLRTRHLRFDMPLLAGRLIEATDWLQHQPSTRDLPIGTFDASTGAAAALIAAAERPSLIGALVSRGVRPDLAGLALRQVQGPDAVDRWRRRP